MIIGKGIAISLSTIGLFGQSPLCQSNDLYRNMAAEWVGAGDVFAAKTGPFLSEDEGEEGAICCEIGEMCQVYAADECPSGTTQVECPCEGEGGGGEENE